MIRQTAKALFAGADLFRRRFPGPRILIYHQVGSDLRREMEVSFEVFRRQLDWMQEHGEIVPFEYALARVQDENADRLFVLSFDDGYRDVYENAFPLLLERRIPFTLYLTTHPIESGLALTPGGRADPLSWDQIRKMNATGLMTLGSHTHRHLDLRKLGSGIIEEELDVSNHLIQERLGVTLRHFAYPWGYWAEKAEPLVKARFSTAVLGAGRPIKPEYDPYRIHRVPIQRSDGMVFFRRKVKRGMLLEETIRRRLRGYKGAPTVENSPAVRVVA